LVSKTFARRIDAERHVVLMESNKLRGDYIDPKASKTLFAQVVETWRAAQVHRPSTAALVETDLRRHLIPAFGSRPIGSVRPSEVQTFVRQLSDHLAPATVERVYRWLASVFRLAVADGLISRTPCAGIKLPPKPERKVDPLRAEDVEALLTELPERYRALAVVGAGAGLRQGEALGLTVPHVDFLRDRALRVEQQLMALAGQPLHLADVKRPSSVRTVPVGDVVLESLAEHLRLYPAATELVGFLSRKPEALVFTDELGRAIRRTSFTAIWRPACRRAGLPDTVTFHDLRHFYASALIAKGASVKVVQARLGHASATETLDTYAHLWPDDDALSRRAIDEVLRGSVAPHTRPRRCLKGHRRRSGAKWW
jgi:integrase